jgi:hypothetical protein
MKRYLLWAYFAISLPIVLWVLWTAVSCINTTRPRVQRLAGVETVSVIIEKSDEFALRMCLYHPPSEKSLSHVRWNIPFVDKNACTIHDKSTSSKLMFVCDPDVLGNIRDCLKKHAIEETQ